MTDTISEPGPSRSDEDALRETSSVTLARLYLEAECVDADGFRLLNYWRGEFFRWDDCVYVRQDPDAFKARVYRYLKTLCVRVEVGRKGRIEIQPFTPEPRQVKAVIETLENECHVLVEVMPAWLDGVARPPSRDVIAFRDGLLYINKFLRDPMTFKEPRSSKWFSTSVIPCDYPREAKSANWLRFLFEALSGDEQRIALLQEWFGYCISGDTSFQKMMFLCGLPGAGKGTVCRTLRRVLGDDNCAAPTMHELAETYGLESLVCKTAAIVADAHLGSKQSQDVLNTVLAITGEDVVNIGRKYKTALTATKLNCRFTVGVNRMPRLADPSNAIMRRLLLVPFDVSFEGKEDRELDAKLSGETAGIVRWSLDGLRRLRQNGKFTEVQAASMLIGTFRRMNSPIEAFVSARCVVSPAVDDSPRVEAGAFFQAYLKWRAENGYSKDGISREGVGADLKASRFKMEKKRLQEELSRKNYYVGIGLLPEHEDDIEEDEQQAPALFEP